MAEYRIQRAGPEHLAALPGIERAAGRLFEDTDLEDLDFDDTTSPEEFQEAQEDGLLWVALRGRDEVVGFALLHDHDGQAHLEEVDVHPAHGRRGLGRRLVDAVCAFAAERRFDSVTLTTFRDVPWNAPFYRSIGFETIPDAELSEDLRELVSEEAERGLDPALRVVMRRRV